MRCVAISCGSSRGTPLQPLPETRADLRDLVWGEVEIRRKHGEVPVVLPARLGLRASFAFCQTAQWDSTLSTSAARWGGVRTLWSSFSALTDGVVHGRTRDPHLHQGGIHLCGLQVSRGEPVGQRDHQVLLGNTGRLHPAVQLECGCFSTAACRSGETASVSRLIATNSVTPPW
jgi:hypothetical protein